MSGDKNECSVCLEEFRQDDETIEMCSAAHKFHTKCARTWIRSTTGMCLTCPLCRERVGVSVHAALVDVDVPIMQMIYLTVDTMEIIDRYPRNYRKVNEKFYEMLQSYDIRPQHGASLLRLVRQYRRRACQNRRRAFARVMRFLEAGDA